MSNAEADSVDVETLFNRYAVVRARSERIVRSWLPPPSTSESAPTQDDQESTDPALDKLDARVAEDWMDTVGIGYRPAGETLEELAGPKRSLLSNDRLRSLLLGTEAGKPGAKGKFHEKKVTITGKLEGVEIPLPRRNGTATEGSTQSKINANGHGRKRTSKDESDSEEDLGRSAIGKKKSRSEE